VLGVERGDVRVQAGIPLELFGDLRQVKRMRREPLLDFVGGRLRNGGADDFGQSAQFLR
jgi:hypothetical protein